MLNLGILQSFVQIKYLRYQRDHPIVPSGVSSVGEVNGTNGESRLDPLHA
jgi:hypothetical protein